MKDLDGRPLGVIEAINKLDGPFTSDDVALLQLLAEQAGDVQHHPHLRLGHRRRGWRGGNGAVAGRGPAGGGGGRGCGLFHRLSRDVRKWQ
jgi:hypothetical protein